MNSHGRALGPRVRCRVKKNKGSNITALALEWTLLSEIVFSTYACNFCRKRWPGDWILKAVLPLKGTVTAEALRERERKNKWGNDIWLFVYTMKERGHTKSPWLCLLYFFANLLPCLKINKVTDIMKESISNMSLIPSLMPHQWQFPLNILHVCLPFFLCFLQEEFSLSLNL